MFSLSNSSNKSHGGPPVILPRVIQELATDDGNNTTFSPTITSPPLVSKATLGSTIEVWITTAQGVIDLPLTVTDSAGQAYVNKGSVLSVVGQQQVLLYVLQNNASATALTVTSAWSHNLSSKGIWVKEIGPVNTVSFDNVDLTEDTNPGTGTDAVTGNLISPNSVPVFVSSLCEEVNVGDASDLVAGTGYTLGIQGWFLGGPALAKSESKVLFVNTPTAATYTAPVNGATGIYLDGIVMYDF